MNRKLSDHRIRATCRALLIRDGSVSGRGLRAELRRRFAAAGKTERIFAIWREETGVQRAAALPHWAAEIDRVRQAGLNASGTAVIIRGLQEQVFKLSRELAAARAALSERAGR
jgi:hypothetical protein